jgi:hypothetical protein
MTLKQKQKNFFKQKQKIKKLALYKGQVPENSKRTMLIKKG